MLKLKVPPPVVGLCVAGLMIVFKLLWPFANLVPIQLKLLAYPIGVMGLLVDLWSVALFFNASTTLNPLKPQKSNQLVTTGFYRFTRNPMYLGMLCLLLGFALWLGNVLGFLLLPVFVWYITRFQIKPEEEALTKLFGDAYTGYQKEVRRWL